MNGIAACHKTAICDLTSRRRCPAKLRRPSIQVKSIGARKSLLKRWAILRRPSTGLKPIRPDTGLTQIVPDGTIVKNCPTDVCASAADGRKRLRRWEESHGPSLAARRGEDASPRTAGARFFYARRKVVCEIVGRLRGVSLFVPGVTSGCFCPLAPALRGEGGRTRPG